MILHGGLTAPVGSKADFGVWQTQVTSPVLWVLSYGNLSK